MKIRHKQSGVVLEGEFVGIQNFFMEMSSSGIAFNSAYSTDHWEEVKPVWVDVTGECRVEDYRDAMGERMLSLYHPKTGQNTLHAANGYRLRKVRCCYDDVNHTALDAFIIERKECA